MEHWIDHVFPTIFRIMKYPSVGDKLVLLIRKAIAMSNMVMSKAHFDTFPIYLPHSSTSRNKSQSIHQVVRTSEMTFRLVELDRTINVIIKKLFWNNPRIFELSNNTEHRIFRSIESFETWNLSKNLIFRIIDSFEASNLSNHRTFEALNLSKHSIFEAIFRNITYMYFSEQGQIVIFFHKHPAPVIFVNLIKSGIGICLFSVPVMFFLGLFSHVSGSLSLLFTAI